MSIQEQAFVKAVAEFPSDFGFLRQQMGSADRLYMVKLSHHRGIEKAKRR